jgi:4-diphosphocytidyl-2-C-methyl-D-erythritol kinase
MRAGRRARTLRVPAYAKINLGLEVLGLRADGYHELRTLFQTIDLHDDLTIEPARKGITLVCDDPTLPTDDGNLAVRAARELLRFARVEAGISATLVKRIPVAGGLGGGSSDAAAMLMALDNLFDLGLGITGLLPVARRLGADVPFFLYGGTALGLSRGDEIYPLRRQIKAHVVVVDPKRPVSTAAVFRRVDARLTPRENGYTIYRFVSSELDGFDGYRVLANDLEEAALEEAPDLARSLRRIRGILSSEGALFVSLSGSGSSFFGLFDDAAAARRAHAALRSRGIAAHRGRTLSLDQYRRVWSRSLAVRGAHRGRSR